MSFYSPDDYDTEYATPPLENRNKRNKRRLPPWIGGLVVLIVLIIGGFMVISWLSGGGSQPVALVRTVTPVPGLLQTAAVHQAQPTTPPIESTRPPATRSAIISPSATPPDTPSDSSQEALILVLVNQARRDIGLGGLSANATLTRTAQLHSDDQAEHETMTHDGSDGSEPWERAERLGYCYRSFGENVLMRWDVSADGAFDQWWNSPPHKANMLGTDFTEIGIAYTRSAGGAYYYTMVLGRPC